ncbi:MAG: hypothetical protein LUQ11_10030 [Methylococcaceae bacterium]|nr:hypothetical protein [Methylococcaceae bacterium]
MDNIRQFLPLCWLSASPLELPRSSRFFQLNIVFYFTVAFFIQFNMSDDIEAIFEVILETLLTVGFVAAILLLNRSFYSFIQVGSAVLFCQNVVALMLVPVVFWVTIAEDTPSYVVLGLFIFWAFVLIAHIFKHVLQINRPASLVVSVFYFLIAYGGAYGIDSLLAG